MSAMKMQGSPAGKEAGRQAVVVQRGADCRLICVMGSEDWDRHPGLAPSGQFTISAAIASGSLVCTVERSGAYLLLAVTAGRQRNVDAPSSARMLPIFDARALTEGITHPVGRFPSGIYRLGSTKPYAHLRW